jgi:hypothetical protein
MKDKAKISKLDPKNIVEEERHILLKELHPLTEGAFEHHITDEDMYNHAFEEDYMFLAIENDKIIGYTAGKIIDGRINYISAVIVSPECQTEGLGKILINHAIDFMPLNLLASQTQNPVLYMSLSNVARSRNYNVFPNSNGNVIEKGLLEDLKQVFSVTDSGLINAGVYGRQLCPHSVNLEGKGKVAELFNALDFDKGDAYLIVCEKS